MGGRRKRGKGIAGRDEAVQHESATSHGLNSGTMMNRVASTLIDSNTSEQTSHCRKHQFTTSLLSVLTPTTALHRR